MVTHLMTHLETARLISSMLIFARFGCQHNIRRSPAPRVSHAGSWQSRSGPETEPCKLCCFLCDTITVVARHSLLVLNTSESLSTPRAPNSTLRARVPLLQAPLLRAVSYSETSLYHTYTNAYLIPNPNTRERSRLSADRHRPHSNLGLLAAPGNVNAGAPMSRSSEVPSCGRPLAVAGPPARSSGCARSGLRASASLASGRK
jgi:hypothetical protein